jgi:hypothetical protein
VFLILIWFKPPCKVPLRVTGLQWKLFESHYIQIPLITAHILQNFYEVDLVITFFPFSNVCLFAVPRIFRSLVLMRSLCFPFSLASVIIIENFPFLRPSFVHTTRLMLCWVWCYTPRILSVFYPNSESSSHNPCENLNCLALSPVKDNDPSSGMWEGCGDRRTLNISGPDLS